MQQTIDDIKVMYPGLELVVDAQGPMCVGYPEPGDLFNVQGTGTTPEEAWQDAYECLTNTGIYSKAKSDRMNYDISIDVTGEDYWMYFYDKDKTTSTDAIRLNEVQANNLSVSLKIFINKFPF